ncbi:MAG: hypothetical protein CO118_01210 [Flavobacteriales bacterium CG_4_9_14_3_um_filter_32_8]|nr:MAG: hypothetical protein CO118_01210 [Flavobacteriales bacterium CG_4_9_14_3_um_filter_32_8]
MKNLYRKLTILFLANLTAFTSYAQYNNAYRIKIIGNSYSDETVIRLVNGATQGFDGMYDAWKLISPNPNVPSIFTQIIPGQILSINALPEFTEDKSVTLYTNIPVSGSYIIEIDEVYALSANYKVSFTDVSTNSHIRIMGDTSLIVNLSAQQNAATFTFNISSSLTTIVNHETCTAMNDGSLEITNTGNNNWEYEITDDNDSVIINNTSNSPINTINSLIPGNYKATVNSLGITDEVNFTINPALVLTANFNLDKDTVYLSEGGLVNTNNTSINAQTYTWDMGDGGIANTENTSYTYSSVGNYQIALTSSNANCTVQNSKPITVLLTPTVVTAINSNNKMEVKLANLGNGNYQLVTANNNIKNISVYDVKGSLIQQATFYENEYHLSLSTNSNGIYLLSVITEDGKIFQEKLVR